MADSQENCETATVLEYEFVYICIHALQSGAPASENTLAVVQRHKRVGKRGKTRSLCKLTCAYHISLSSRALLNTWLAVADRYFLLVVNISSSSALCCGAEDVVEAVVLVHSTEADAIHCGILGVPQKRRNPWEQQIKKPSKQTKM